MVLPISLGVKDKALKMTYKDVPSDVSLPIYLHLLTQLPLPIISNCTVLLVFSSWHFVLAIPIAQNVVLKDIHIAYSFTSHRTLPLSKRCH